METTNVESSSLPHHSNQPFCGSPQRDASPRPDNRLRHDATGLFWYAFVRCDRIDGAGRPQMDAVLFSTLSDRTRHVRPSYEITGNHPP
ncbi:MAG: hypothetical protein CMJ48_08730 [Planctomycetaceae bacterium]|nr:hypothetical protein [Planctomycetaceae bacterium]